MFQKTLDNDKDMKNSFINAEVDESDSEDDTCEIIIPKRKKKKGIDTSQELLFQLIKQHHILSKTQKKMYELQSEIDKEEVSTRYIKLELNNTQVNLEKNNVLMKECRTHLLYAKIENWSVRCIVVAYILHNIWMLISPFN